MVLRITIGVDLKIFFRNYNVWKIAIGNISSEIYIKGAGLMEVDSHL